MTSLLLPFLPIAAREARETSRRPRAYHARWIIGALGIGAILFALWVERHLPDQGDAAFLALACLAQIYALFAGVIVSADVIAFERREGTLGLLFLTDLKPMHVLAGKFLSCSTTAFFGLLAMLPLLAVPLLLGGVSLDRFVLLAINLINTLFLSLSIGFLTSSIFLHGWAALTAGLSIMAALGIGLPIFAAWFDIWNPLTIAAPTMGLLVVWDAPVTELKEFWQSFVFNQVVAWGNVALVSARLVYLWRDRPATPKEQRRNEVIAALRFGSRRSRTYLRRKLLDQNPLAWLAHRKQVGSVGLLLFSTAMFLGILGPLLFTAEWDFEDAAALAFWALALAHLALFFRICVAASQQIAEDRRSGALELLLATPMSVREIIRGRWLALVRQFFGPALVILFMQFVFVGGWFAFALNYAEYSTLWERTAALELAEEQTVFLAVLFSALLLPANWIVAVWVGMWRGLRCKTPAGAVWSTLTTVLVAPWIVFIIAFALIISLGDFSDPYAWSVMLYGGFVWGVIVSAFLIRGARRNLTRHFRTAAAGRFQDFREPFPWRLTFRFGAIAGAGFLLSGS